MDQNLLQRTIEILQSNYSFRRNEITKRIEFKETAEQTYRVMTDSDFNTIWRFLTASEIKCSKSNLKSIIHSNFSSSYDPFRDYFDSLPTSDASTDYIGQLANCIVLADDADKSIFMRFFRIFLRAIVACAYDSIPNHACLTLVGAQGKFKTTFLNYLCPKSLKGKYLHSGSISADKDSQIRLSTCFLINNDELASLKRTDIETFKSMITQNDIHVRLPYGYFAETLKRRASFVASLNKLNFLTDTTGSRRFIIFEIVNIDMNTAKSIDIDLVYAQALAEYKSGEQYFFTQEDNVLIQSMNQRFDQISTVEDLLLSKFYVPKDGSIVLEMGASDIAKEIFSFGHKPTETEIRKVGNFLSKHEFIQKTKRINGVQKRLWQVSRISNTVTGMRNT